MGGSLNPGLRKLSPYSTDALANWRFPTQPRGTNTRPAAPTAPAAPTTPAAPAAPAAPAGLDYIELAKQTQQARALRGKPQGQAPAAGAPAAGAPAAGAPAAGAPAADVPPQQQAQISALRGTPEGYALFNPFALGKSGEDLARARGFRWEQGDEGPGGWYEQSMNNEGAEGWSRVRGGDDNDFTRVTGTPDDAWYAQEKARQQGFASKLLPTIQKNRADIWEGFNKSYGDKAAENLYKQWYGGNNSADKNAFGYDFAMPELAGEAYIPEGGRSLFDQARGAGTHFQIASGRGYHPYSEDEIAANPNLLNTIGTFYDPSGKAAIGGVSSRPKSHGLSEFATMMPMVLGGGVMSLAGAPAWAKALSNVASQGVTK